MVYKGSIKATSVMHSTALEFMRSVNTYFTINELEATSHVTSHSTDGCLNVVSDKSIVCKCKSDIANPVL